MFGALLGASIAAEIVPVMREMFPGAIIATGIVSLIGIVLRLMTTEALCSSRFDDPQE